MSYEEEIEDLEERLLMYKGVTGGHPARASLLSEKIKSMEKQLDILKKAEGFDEIKECLHSAQSSIERSKNRKEERDHAVAFFNTLVEMDILGLYESRDEE